MCINDDHSLFGGKRCLKCWITYRNPLYKTLEHIYTNICISKLMATSLVLGKKKVSERKRRITQSL